MKKYVFSIKYSDNAKLYCYIIEQLQTSLTFCHYNSNNDRSTFRIKMEEDDFLVLALTVPLIIINQNE